jgi:hypothetical protein
MLKHNNNFELFFTMRTLILLAETAERYTGKTKSVMRRELGSETDDRAARGRERP